MSVDEGTHGVRELEAEIDGLARYLLAPHQRECVLCYVNRMVVEFGCDHTLRWAVTWRAVRAPQATKLLTRLRSRAGYCDCGIFTNGWDVTVDTVLDPGTGEECWPPEVAGCRGVHPGSTRPCSLWAPRPS
ncbi:MAG: DUF2695 domain-containing protein [Georgenia sp.]